MDIELHPDQLTVFQSKARFKVCAAGRRFGKSYLAAVTLFVEASKNTKMRTDGVEVDLSLEEVYYIAPTFEQGKKILWPLLNLLGQGLIRQKYENTGTLTLINGRRISVKGSDRPDSLRGIGQSHVVLDEYAMMKPEVWQTIIIPQLANSEGTALFIGTPDGKNHFYDLWADAKTGKAGPEWEAFTFKSTDNPYLPRTEFEMLSRNMSEALFKQEMEASFDSGGGLLMSKSMFPIVDVVPIGDTYIAIDLAGFQKVEGGRRMRKLDDHAIAVVLNHAGGWCILDIIYGQWDTRETSLRIVKAYRDYRPLKLGVEKGMAKNAVLPYLSDEMNRLNTFFEVHDLTHGNQQKTDRIAWSMQGRAEKGRISCLSDENKSDKDKWVNTFLGQCSDFPSQLTHDDLIDAVSYTDQLADPWMDLGEEGCIDDWAPMDSIAGY